MASITTLSQSVFAIRKDEAIRNQVMRKEMYLSEFQVSGDSIIVDGVAIQMSPNAKAKLLTRLRIPKAFAERFKGEFGDEGLSQLLSMMKGQKDLLLTLIVDTKSRMITDFLPEGYASISNESFVDFTERYIDQYNLGVTHFGSNEGGGAIINTISQNGIFRVPGMDDEIFQTGVSFRNDPIRGLEVSPFLNRLVCTNGMTSNLFEERFQLMNLSDKKINEFNEHMLNLAANNFQPSQFAEKIRMANETEASLSEVQTAMNNILSVDKNVQYDFAQRFVPLEKAMRAYNDHGVDTTQLTKKQMESASSGMTVWQVVNGMTNFASNQTKVNISDATRGKLMIQAGNILMKPNFDTEGRLNVNPFANQMLLTEKESNRIMGNLN